MLDDESTDAGEIRNQRPSETPPRKSFSTPPRELFVLFTFKVNHVVDIAKCERN